MKLKVPANPMLDLILERDDLYPLFALMATKKVSSCIEAKITIFDKDIFKTLAPKSDILFDKAHLVLGIIRKYNPNDPCHTSDDTIYLEWFHDSDIDKNEPTGSHYVDLMDERDDDFCYWHDFTREASYDYESFDEFSHMLNSRLISHRSIIEKFSQDVFDVGLNIFVHDLG